MRARGCKAGLKQNAKLLANDVQLLNQSQSGISRIHASIISNRASVITSRDVSDNRSLSADAPEKLRSLPNLENNVQCIMRNYIHLVHRAYHLSLG